MKARNVLWPVVIMSALSLAGACGSDDGGGGGGDPVGGSDSTGDGGTSNGATSSDGGTKQTGGMSTSDAGETTTGGTDATAGAAGMTGVGGAGIDLCADLDLECDDDDDPCTEDECNPATGECGIPRSGTSCDDGVFCNGNDTCAEGACTEHEGDPCNGQACNEADNACECEVDEDCPADMPGEWSECAYATTCVEMGTRTRAVAKFSCDNGACVQEAAVENEACPRETDGLSCDDGLRCNGTDKCKAGNCDHTGNPCAGGGADADGCWEKDTMCRACGVGASCAVKYSCCSSGGGTTASCQSGFTCGIIIDDIRTNPAP